MEIKIAKGETHHADHHDHNDDDQKLPLLLKDLPSLDEVERTRIQQALSQAFQSTAHLAKRLPTGTLMAFQLLSPILSNQGQCDTSANRAMTSALVFFCGLSSFLLSFTDTFRDRKGNVSHGVATFRGLWLIDGAARISAHVGEKYRLRPIDFVHAFMTVLVLVTMALFDKNTVRCFCPTPSKGTREILTLLPVGIGALCGVLFVVFPTKRHGIGFPLSPY